MNAEVLRALSEIGLDASAQASKSLDDLNGEEVDEVFVLAEEAGRPAAELAWSDVLDVVRDTEGVRKVGDDFLLNGARADVQLRLREFPVLGAVTLLDGNTGAPF